MQIEKKEAVFTLGLPGAGKSTAIKQLIKERKVPFNIVSADDIREKHFRYDPKHPERIHEECVLLADQEMLKYTNEGKKLIIMDGGGINNSYTKRIIERTRALGYKITILYVNTPSTVCISRNVERMKKGERFVPIEAILDKAFMLRKCVLDLHKIADEFIEIKHFRDDVIFVDMDGTIAEYYKLPKDLNGNIDFVNYDIFKYSKAVWEVIDKLRILEAEGKRICILSASPNNICNNDKIEWLEQYLPFIKKEDIFFCGNKQYKHVFLEQLMKKFKLKPEQVMVIDDDHNVLELMEPLNVNSMHPSSFLTNY